MAAQNCGFLIDDEDAVAYVAHRMMVADQSYDGSSQRSTWRYNQAKYAIMRLVAKLKQKKPKVYSLDYGWQQKEDGHGTTFVERVQAKDHEDIYETFEEICNRAKPLLNDKQYECFIKYYRDHMTMQAIADEIGVSKERVRQHLNKGKEILRQCLSKLDL